MLWLQSQEEHEQIAVNIAMKVNYIILRLKLSITALVSQINAWSLNL